jgi:hypothetical protein
MACVILDLMVICCHDGTTIAIKTMQSLSVARHLVEGLVDGNVLVVLVDENVVGVRLWGFTGLIVAATEKYTIRGSWPEDVGAASRLQCRSVHPRAGRASIIKHG